MRIVIVEDEHLTRDLIRKVCETEFGHEVIGQTGSAFEAVKLIEKLVPDVVILDLSLPDATGFEVIRQVSPTPRSVRFLVLSAHCEEYTAYRVEKAQISGFLDKGTNSVIALGNALQALERGDVYFSAAYQRIRAATILDQGSFLKLLSDQELVILSFVGGGFSDESIGRALCISPRTVQTHRSNISRKVNIHDIKSLMAFAQKKGLSLFS